MTLGPFKEFSSTDRVKILLLENYVQQSQTLTAFPNFKITEALKSKVVWV